MKQNIQLKHTWQEDPELLSVNLMEPRQRCGLACLHMVIEHYMQQDISADEIFRRAESYEAINEHNDWWHPGQVRVLQSYGLTAWRRNWTAPPNGPSYLAIHEGYTEAQMQAVTHQMQEEERYRALSERFTHSVNTALLRGAPVIVSVKSDFSHNKENHQVVVAGFDSESRVYSVYDPVMQAGPSAVSEVYLLEYVNYWAIFVSPRGSSSK